MDLDRGPVGLGLLLEFQARADLITNNAIYRCRDCG